VAGDERGRIDVVRAKFPVPGPISTRYAVSGDDRGRLEEIRTRGIEAKVFVAVTPIGVLI
jgi:hypothetical protein